MLQAFRVDEPNRLGAVFAQHKADEQFKWNALMGPLQSLLESDGELHEGHCIGQLTYGDQGRTSTAADEPLVWMDIVEPSVAPN